MLNLDFANSVDPYQLTFQHLNLVAKVACADQEGGSQNHKTIGILINTSPDPLENHKATKPAFNVVTLSALQRNAIKMAFCWQGDDGPLLVIFGSTKTTTATFFFVKVGPHLAKKFWIHAWVATCSLSIKKVISMEDDNT